jgi:hypothetical protein
MNIVHPEYPQASVAERSCTKDLNGREKGIGHETRQQLVHYVVAWTLKSIVDLENARKRRTRRRYKHPVEIRYSRFQVSKRRLSS